MNSIELVVILLLLFMGVPDACRWLGRPALVYPAFVLFGFLVGPLVRQEVVTMIQQAGEIGFLLLLFEVGLEIELPKPHELVRPSAFAARWVLAQYPVVLALARFAGLGWLESFVAAAALTGCSVGMAHAAWKHHPAGNEAARMFVLHVMVLLELVTIVLLSVETAVLGRGPSWLFVFKLLGIALVVFICSRVAVPLARLFQHVLEKATHWRIHFVTVLVLVVCAVGERLGLSGAKTAFFLGLFMSRVRHAGQNLEDYLAPISRRFLIPLFFVALGMQVPLSTLWTRAALLAVVAAALLLAFRDLLHRRWLNPGGPASTALLLSPNLTMVALAGSAFLQQDRPASAAWTLLTGMFITIVAIMALPRAAPAAGPSPAAA